MSEIENPSVNEGRRFAGNTAWVFVGQLGGKLGGLIFFVIVARVLGVREYGFFNFAVAFVPLFLSLGGFGLEPITIRELARDPARTSELFASALVTRITAGVIGFLLSIAIGIFFIETGDALVTLVFIGFALLVDELTSVYTSVFRAFERMRLSAIIKIINRLVSALLALLALLIGGDLMEVIIAYVLGSITTLVWAHWTMTREYPPVRLRGARRAIVWELFREGRSLGIAGVLNFALFRIDTVMIEAIKGAFTVGLYGVAYRFFESFLFVAQSLMTVGLPRIAKQGPGDAANRTFELLLSLALAFYLPIVLGAPFVDDWLVETLFTTRYAAAAEAVPWLTGAALFYAITYLARVSAVGLGESRSITNIALVALISNVALNLYLIPAEGFVGAAIATFVVEVAEALLTLLVLRRRGVPVFRLSLILVPVIASVAMWIVLLVANRVDGAALALGVGTYSLALPVSAYLLAPEKTRRALQIIRHR